MLPPYTSPPTYWEVPRRFLEGSWKAARGCRPTPRRPPPPTAPNESAGAVSCDLVRSRAISCDRATSCKTLGRSGAIWCDLMQSHAISRDRTSHRASSPSESAIARRFTRHAKPCPPAAPERGEGRGAVQRPRSAGISRLPRAAETHPPSSSRSLARSHLNLVCSRRSLGAVSAQSRPSGGRGLSAGKRASPGRSPSSVKSGCEERGWRGGVKSGFEERV